MKYVIFPKDHDPSVEQLKGRLEKNGLTCLELSDVKEVEQLMKNHFAVIVVTSSSQLAQYAGAKNSWSECPIRFYQFMDKKLVAKSIPNYMTVHFTLEQVSQLSRAITKFVVEQVLEDDQQDEELDLEFNVHNELN
jgi:hypothetical protein